MIKEIAVFIGIAMILAASGCVGGGDHKGNSTEVKTTSGPLTKDDILGNIKGGYSSNTVEVTEGNVVVYHEVLGDGWKYHLDIYDAGEILKKIFKDSRVASATVIIPLHGSDKYGQKKTATAMKFKLTNLTAAKINWDNFNTDNLASVADDAYIDPNLDR